MRIGGIRRVVTSVLLCVFVLGMFIVFPQANGLEVPMYYIYSLEEYEAELAKYALPGDYVTYDMIKSVGQFVMMRLGTSKTLTADHINFVLRDKTGVRINFSANYPTEYNGLAEDKTALAIWWDEDKNEIWGRFVITNTNGVKMPLP